METKKVNKILDKWNRDPDYATEILAEIHEKWNGFPEDILRHVADEMKTPLGRLYHIATFFDWKDAETPDYPILKTKYEPIVFRNLKQIKPKDIETYIGVGGYKSLEKAIKQMSPSDVIEEIKRSGLVGRSGGGTPTGLKWESCAKFAKSSGKPPVLICNAYCNSPSDEKLLRCNPHAIIEGMIINAYAIGANEGILFVNSKNIKANNILKKALTASRERGFIGEKILDGAFRFGLMIHFGQDVKVSGVSDELLSCVTGFAPEPKGTFIPKFESGYKDLPTVISNVETLANIPAIIEKGGTWYAGTGKGTPGTKIILLDGKVAKPGYVEVPLGITLREIVNKIGKIKDINTIKAIQIGGLWGGFVPSGMFNETLDYNSLKNLDCSLYDSTIRVLDNETCMPCELLNSMELTASGSCGKCVPCRDGLQNICMMIEKIMEGKGYSRDLESLESLAKTIKTTSLCGYGRVAPSPILTAIKHFRNEFEKHNHG